MLTAALPVAAHLAFWVSLALLAHGCPQGEWNLSDGVQPTFGRCELEWIYDNYVQVSRVASSAAVQLHDSERR